MEIRRKSTYRKCIWEKIVREMIGVTLNIQIHNVHTLVRTHTHTHTHSYTQSYKFLFKACNISFHFFFTLVLQSLIYSFHFQVLILPTTLTMVSLKTPGRCTVKNNERLDMKVLN